MWGDVARPAMSVAVVHCVFPPPRQAVSCERDSKPQKDCCDALPMSNKCEFKESLSEISQTTEVAPGASIHNSRWLDPRHFLEVIRVRGRKCNACSFSLYYLSYHIPHVGYWMSCQFCIYDQRRLGYRWKMSFVKQASVFLCLCSWWWQFNLSKCCLLCFGEKWFVSGFLWIIQRSFACFDLFVSQAQHSSTPGGGNGVFQTGCVWKLI